MNVPFLVCCDSIATNQGLITMPRVSASIDRLIGGTMAAAYLAIKCLAAAAMTPSATAAITAMSHF